MARNRIEIIDKLRDGELIIYRQSKKSISGKVYLGRQNGKAIYKYNHIQTDDVKLAKTKLKEWCDEIKVYHKNGDIEKYYPSTNNAKYLLENYIKQYEKDDFNSKSAKENDVTNSKNILRFIKEKKISTWKKKTLTALQEWLRETGYAENTVTHHMMVLRRMFRFYIDDEQMKKSEMPDFPENQKVSGKVTFLSRADYKHLKAVSEKRMYQRGLARTVELTRKTLHHYLTFMIGTGLRRSEGHRVKYKDITVKSSKKGEYYLSIKNVTAKGKTRTVTSKTSSYYAFKELQKLYMEYRDYVTAGKDDFLFQHDFISSGRNLLKAANLYSDDEGNENNLTITRKTYICWGLINDENIFDIAKNCGNSSEVIEKYYANKLTSVQLEDRLHKIYKSGLSIIK